MDVALISAPFGGNDNGAVYRPVGVMVPPPLVTAQVTVAGERPVTEAVYCWVAPKGILTHPCKIVTVWADK